MPLDLLKAELRRRRVKDGGLGLTGGSAEWR